MGKRGPQPLAADVTALRGTLRPSRERSRRRQPALALVKPAVSVADSPAAVRDYVDIARRYASNVRDGRIVAGQWLIKAVTRDRRDHARATEDPSWPFVWSDAHVIEACSFIERLPHVEGRWGAETIRLEPWQVFIVATLIGWRHRAQPARRRFTVFYLEVARKSAKTTLVVALALYHLLFEREPGAQVVFGASTGAQARIAFSICQRMVRRASWLREAGLAAYANAITFEAEGGSARPVNARACSLDGLNPSCIVLDESHAQTYALHDVLRSAQGARDNPLLMCPTTAGYDQLSVGYALRTALTKTLDQVFDSEHLFGVVYTLDEGDDWRDPLVWAKANPMLGITPTLNYAKTYCLDAQQTPGLEGEFKTKICNLWLQSATSWLSMDSWDRCADKSLTLEDFEGATCWMGGDLAQLDDLAAIALLFERDGLLVGFVRNYLPSHVVDTRARAVPAYREWVRDGQLTVTDGSMIDYSVIERDVRQWCQRFEVQSITFDQYGALQLSSRLLTDGLPAVLSPKNARTFTPPGRELEARVQHTRFRHDGNTCLKWQASNCVVSRRTDDSILPKKESTESPNKIDAIDALLLAISGWQSQPALTAAPSATWF